MLSTLFKRAQRSVDETIDQAVNRAIIAIPFLVALGFATASAYLRLETLYGSEDATMFIAGGFAIVGVFAWLILGRPQSAMPIGDEAKSDEASALRSASSEEDAEHQSMDPADKALLSSAVSAAAPLAMASVFRLIMRNPGIAAALVGAIILWLNLDGDPEPATATPEEA